MRNHIHMANTTKQWKNYNNFCTKNNHKITKKRGITQDDTGKYNGNTGEPATNTTHYGEYYTNTTQTLQNMRNPGKCYKNKANIRQKYNK